MATPQPCVVPSGPHVVTDSTERNGSPARVRRLKLIDFDIAKAQVTQQTARGELFGKLVYMSPEQWRQEKLTTKTDVYSLGIVLYYLLVNEFPLFRRAPSDFTQIQRLVLATAREPIRITRPDVPAPFARVLERMLMHDATKRPSSAEMFTWLSRAHAVNTATRE